jgi:hypothetical protein
VGIGHSGEEGLEVAPFEGFAATDEGPGGAEGIGAIEEELDKRWCEVELPASNPGHEVLDPVGRMFQGAEAHGAGRALEGVGGAE